MIDNLNSQRSFKNYQYLKIIADGHNFVSGHTLPKGKHKKEKEATTLKSEEEAKALAFTQIKSKGDTYFMCGKKKFHAIMFPEKDSTLCTE